MKKKTKKQCRTKTIQTLLLMASGLILGLEIFSVVDFNKWLSALGYFLLLIALVWQHFEPKVNA